MRSAAFHLHPHRTYRPAGAPHGPRLGQGLRERSPVGTGNPHQHSLHVLGFRLVTRERQTLTGRQGHRPSTSPNRAAPRARGSPRSTRQSRRSPRGHGRREPDLGPFLELPAGVPTGPSAPAPARGYPGIGDHHDLSPVAVRPHHADAVIHRRSVSSAARRSARPSSAQPSSSSAPRRSTPGITGSAPTVDTTSLARARSRP